MHYLLSQVQSTLDDRDRQIEQAVSKPLKKQKTSKAWAPDQLPKDSSQSHKSIQDSVTEKSGARNLWNASIKQLFENQEELALLVKKIRELAPYSVMYQNQKRLPTFKKQFQDEWLRVEGKLAVTLLYHSNSVEEVFSYVQGKTQKNPQVEEKMKALGQLLNEFVSWMLSRLNGARDFQFLIRDVLEAAQKSVDKHIEVRETERRLKAVVRIQQLFRRFKKRK